MVIDITDALIDKIAHDLREKIYHGEQDNAPQYKILQETQKQFNIYNKLLNKGNQNDSNTA